MSLYPEQYRYITQNHLKKIVWTDRLIALLLGAPDKFDSTSFPGRTVPMFDRERVRLAEETNKFKQAHERWDAKRRAREVASSERLQQAKEYAATAVVRIERLPCEELFQRARAAYEETHGKGSASTSSTLDFASVDYLLRPADHVFRRLAEIAGKEDVTEMRLKLLADTIDRIGRMYPLLSKFCARESRRVRAKIFPG